MNAYCISHNVSSMRGSTDSQITAKVLLFLILDDYGYVSSVSYSGPFCREVFINV